MQRNMLCYIYDVNPPDTLTISGVRKNIKTKIQQGFYYYVRYGKVTDHQKCPHFVFLSIDHYF